MPLAIDAGCGATCWGVHSPVQPRGARGAGAALGNLDSPGNYRQEPESENKVARPEAVPQVLIWRPLLQINVFFRKWT